MIRDRSHPRLRYQESLRQTLRGNTPMTDSTLLLTFLLLAVVVWRLSVRSSNRESEIQKLRQQNDQLQKELEEARQKLAQKSNP